MQPVEIHQGEDAAHHAQCALVLKARSALSDARRTLLEIHGLRQCPDLNCNSGIKHLLASLSDEPCILPWPSGGWKYTDAMDQYIRALLRVDGRKATELAFEQILICHHIGQRLRGSILVYMTAALLQLGEGKLCVKYQLLWRTLSENCPLMEPDELKERYLLRVLVTNLGDDINDEYLSEMLDRRDRSPICLQYATPQVLLEISWIQDLINLQNFRQLEGWFMNQLNYDVTYYIRGFLVDSDVVRGRPDLWRQDNEARIARLQAGQDALFKYISIRYASFWTDLITAIEDTSGTVGVWKEPVADFSGALMMPRFPRVHAMELVNLLHPIWKRTPGAVQWVKQSLENTERELLLEDCGPDHGSVDVKSEKMRQRMLRALVEKQEEAINAKLGYF
ncbi:hypothetical protein H072_6804 [Dactylellina haptotyla CBS 200.50]|uniref:Uncharacterized protein n=1 Tax=Dactylellina haptotyla (strain CBS 200.50) TaxID=1284197 RepID=S8BJE4_DACHA|nr:hypothetical protein H072_6804 [Dactylellina haptotyla CBS 200.50]